MKNKKDFVRAIALATVMLILFTILVMFVGCASETPETQKPDVREPIAWGIIIMPEGEKIEGNVTRYILRSADMIELTLEDTVYIAHSSRVVLIEK